MTLTPAEIEKRKAEDLALAALLERDPVAGAKALIDTLATRHGLTVRIRPKMPADAGGFYYRSQKTIEVPPLTSESQVEDWLATALHETGHHLSTGCSGPLHHRDTHAGKYSHCLWCEHDAWQHAMRLYRFTPAMYQDMQRSQGWVLKNVTAPSQARAEAELAASDAGVAADRARWDAHAARLERQRQAEQSVFDDKVRSGYFTCREPGCRNNSAVALRDGAAVRVLCRNHHVDLQIADMKQRVADMRSRQGKAPAVRRVTGRVSFLHDEGYGLLSAPGLGEVRMLSQSAWRGQQRARVGQAVTFTPQTNRVTGVVFASDVAVSA